jgi:hypothetical protein
VQVFLTVQVFLGSSLALDYDTIFLFYKGMMYGSTLFFMYSVLHLKRCSGLNFYSYVVHMERRTFVLHLELSLKIRSRARHTVNSWKKEQDDGLQANCYYELISCVLVNLKHVNYSESTPISNEPLRLTRTHYET